MHEQEEAVNMYACPKRRIRKCTFPAFLYCTDFLKSWICSLEVVVNKLIVFVDKHTMKFLYAYNAVLLSINKL